MELKPAGLLKLDSITLFFLIIFWKYQKIPVKLLLKAVKRLNGIGIMKQKDHVIFDLISTDESNPKEPVWNSPEEFMFFIMNLLPNSTVAFLDIFPILR